MLQAQCSLTRLIQYVRGEVPRTSMRLVGGSNLKCLYRWMVCMATRNINRSILIF